MKAINKRRSALEQSVQATFGIFGRWSPFKVLICGSSFEEEKSFLLKKGVPEDQLIVSSFSDLESSLSEQQSDIVLLGLNFEDTKGSYREFLNILYSLRDSTKSKRVLFIESDIMGYNEIQKVEDPDATIKAIYIQVLSYLEEKLSDKYVTFHEALIREVQDEDYEKRLCTIFENDDIKEHLKDETLTNLLKEAQKLALIRSHSSKSFESAFIAGNELEMEKLQELLKSKSKWDEFKKSFPKLVDEELRYHQINDSQTDPEVPGVCSEIWNELETLAGSFFDYHCSKAFNRLSSEEKVDLTDDIKYEKKQSPAETNQPDINSNFRKFQVQDNGLGSLMGGGGGFNTNLPISPLDASTPSVIPSQQEEKYKLNDYGDVVLAMIAAWHRQCVFVGGALYEYGYYNEDNNYILGNIIVLDRDEKLLKHVNALSEGLGLPKIKKNINANEVLKSFFSFETNYINFYEKVRSQLKLSLSFHLGSISQQDYEDERKAVEESQKKFTVDLEQKKIKEQKLAKQAESSFKARMGLLKNLKSAKAKPTKEIESIIEEEIENIPEFNLTEEEKLNLTESLEFKRLELEEQIEIEKKEREELENAIQEEQEVRDQKRRDIEEQRRKQQELEKAERLKRQQRLIEERKKREEVKKMRAKTLREAFEKARENAIKKQETKSAANANDKDSGSDKKQGDKKKFNPEAVKMMIRFGTDDKKIISSTGIDAEDLAELKQVVAEEDQQLTQ